MDNLQPLYRSMRDQEIERFRFSYSHRNVTFDVIFMIDEAPFVLLFGARGHAFSMEFEVHQGFNVNPKLEPEKYKELCRLLDIRYNPDAPFSPRAFLEIFNEHIPGVATAAGRAQPHHVAAIRRDVEESHKIYFCAWLDNNKAGNTVTAENLHKTRRLLGQQAFETCRRKNLSSRWTDRKELAQECVLPDC
nr:DUF6037 family protein [Solimonas marina]